MNKEFKISVLSAICLLILGVSGCAQYTRPTWTDVNSEGTAYVGQGPLNAEHVGERAPSDSNNHIDNPSDSLSHSTPPSVADAETYGYESGRSTAYSPNEPDQSDVSYNFV